MANTDGWKPSVDKAFHPIPVQTQPTEFEAGGVHISRKPGVQTKNSLGNKQIEDYIPFSICFLCQMSRANPDYVQTPIM